MDMQDGQIEDLLQTSRPVRENRMTLSGPARLQAKLVIPPRNRRVNRASCNCAGELRAVKGGDRQFAGVARQKLTGLKPSARQRPERRRSDRAMCYGTFADTSC